MIMDPMYFFFALPALLLAMYAQFKVQGAFNKYSQIRNTRNVPGSQAAQYLLSAAGLQNVQIEGTQGTLTDHYDPRGKKLRLSSAVATQPSVAALGIVAHEIGHAQQDHQGYTPMRLRAGLVPMVNLSSWLGPILFFAGLIFAPQSRLPWLGIILFSLSAIFALITLPVELNASARAKQMLAATGLITNTEEQRGVSQVLDAAAWTYVAAVAQALSTLLYYVFILTGFSRRRD